MASSSSSSAAHVSTGPKNGEKEEKRESVAQIAARLRSGEDFKLAYALQEEEFRTHYSKNRDMARDGKMSREEQMAELERMDRERAEMAQRDAELALELARAMEAEEDRARMEQAKMDAELARRLQKGELQQKEGE